MAQTVSRQNISCCTLARARTQSIVSSAQAEDSSRLLLTTEMSVHGGLAKPTRAHLAARMKAESTSIASAKLPAWMTVGNDCAKTSDAVPSESK